MVGILNRVRGLFAASGYDGANGSTRRRQISKRLKSRDEELRETERKQMWVNTRHLQRNVSLAAWAVRRHLDYVSTFNFQMLSDNDELNKRVEELVGWWSEPRNFDVAGRHGLHSYVRLAEERSLVDGDLLTVRRNNGLVQGIEADRIRDPDGTKKTDNWTQGVQTNKDGRALRYGIWKRQKQQEMVFDKTISARNAHLLAYYERFDQVRGVSPFAPAINHMQDVYEGIEYSLAKAKLNQMLGLVFTRDAGDDPNNDMNHTVSTTSAVNTETGETTEKRYNMADLGKAIWKMELDPGDKVEVKESNNPSHEFQAWMTATIGIALKAIDLPMSFYDEAHTNFHGARTAFVHYDKSAETKRKRLRQLLNWLTYWRLQMFIRDGFLTLPRGMLLTDLKFEWIHIGTPWFDPAKEITADLLAINGNLMTRAQVYKMRFGGDWKEIVSELQKEKEMLEAAGLNANLPTSINANIDLVKLDEGEDDGDENEDQQAATVQQQDQQGD